MGNKTSRELLLKYAIKTAEDCKSGLLVSLIEDPDNIAFSDYGAGLHSAYPTDSVGYSDHMLFIVPPDATIGYESIW